MNCPYCQTELNDYNISFCPECGLDFKTGRKFVSNINPLGVKLPIWSSVKNEGDRLVIKLKNSDTPICIIYIPFITTVFFLMAAESSLNLTWDVITLILAASAIIGAGTYLYLLSNLSTLTVDNQNMVSKMSGEKEKIITSSSIRQIYCKMEKKLVKRVYLATAKYGGNYVTYDVYHYFSLLALLENGTHLIIMDNINSALTAQFLEEKIEEKLGIINQSIKGEYEEEIKKEIQNINFTQNDTTDFNAKNWMEDENALIIKKPWSSEDTYIMQFLLFSIFLAILPISSSGTMITDDTGTHILMVVILLLMNIYLGLMTVKNSTNITVNENGIDIQISPIWWPGSRFLKYQNIKDIYVTDTIRKNESPTYNIMAIMFNGKKYAIMRNVQSLGSAQIGVYKIKCKLGRDPLKRETYR